MFVPFISLMRSGEGLSVGEELRFKYQSSTAHSTTSVLQVGECNYEVNGGLGNDYINGGNGNDVLRGRDSDDVLEGGNGDDHINGESDRSQLFEGSGNDIYYIQNATTAVFESASRGKKR